MASPDHAPAERRVPFARELRARARREQEARVAAALAAREASAAGAGVEHPASFPVVVVPSNRARLAPLPPERRAAFRAHLARVIHDGWRRHVGGAARGESGDVEPLPAASLAAVLGGACATCAGHCCQMGGVRAFLSADTFHRYFDERPRATRRDALREYLSWLGRAASHERSCVFHGRDGCHLPRALRSDTCNRYHCGALAQLMRAASADADAAPRAFVASCDGTRVDAAAFVEAGALRVARPRVPRPDAQRQAGSGDGTLVP